MYTGLAATGFGEPGFVKQVHEFTCKGPCEVI